MSKSGTGSLLTVCFFLSCFLISPCCSQVLSSPCFEPDLPYVNISMLQGNIAKYCSHASRWKIGYVINLVRGFAHWLVWFAVGKRRELWSASGHHFWTPAGDTILWLYGYRVPLWSLHQHHFLSIWTREYWLESVSKSLALCVRGGIESVDSRAKDGKATIGRNSEPSREKAVGRGWDS